MIKETTESSAPPPAPVAAQPTRLWNKNYILLWQGQFVSGLGNSVFDVALALWIVQATNSASLMGLLLALSSIPQIVLAPFGGVLADRVSRKRIIVTCDLLAGVLVLSLALLVLFFPQMLVVAVTWLFMVSVGLSVVGAFFGPAAQAMVPDLVPSSRISGALSLSQLSGRIALFIGAGLSGLLFRLLGAPVLFLVNGLSFFYASASESLITEPRPVRPPAESQGWRARAAEVRRDLLEGLRFVWKSTGLRTLVLVSALGNFFSAPFLSLLQFYLRDYLHVPRYEDWVGYLGAALSVGSLIGLLIVGLARLQGRRRAIAIQAIMLLDASLYSAFVFVPGPLGALVLVALSGLTGAFLIVNISTVVQLSTPRELRGRVFGLLGTISGSITPIAIGFFGVVTDLTGKNIGLIYMVCSAVLLLLALFILFSSNIRGFLAYEPDDVTGTAVGPVAKPVDQ